MIFKGRKYVPLLLLFSAVMAVDGCTGSPVQPEAENLRVVEDDLGNRVGLPSEVTRVVSLAPNLTEIIYAIGAGETLVGVTTFCDYPEQASKVKKVGDTLKPNIETIVGLKPQVVFVTTASQLESFFKVLKEQEIRVFVTNPDSVEGVYSGIKKIGRVLGREDAAAELTSRLEKRIRSAEERAETADGSNRVFVQIDKSLYTIGKGSFISDALTRIGYKSVTDDIDNPYPKISKERARALDPDLIIISESVGNDEPNEVLHNSSAVRSGRVHKIDADVLSRPGPRFAEALESLVEMDRRWKSGEREK